MGTGVWQQEAQSRALTVKKTYPTLGNKAGEEHGNMVYLPAQDCVILSGYTPKFDFTLRYW